MLMTQESIKRPNIHETGIPGKTVWREGHFKKIHVKK